MLQDKLGVLLGHLHHLGNEQKLPRDAASRKRRFQLLIDDALVSGVLIHEDDAIGGFRNDVGLVQLRPRGADKGVAVEALMRRASFAGRVPVFIGDDVTDEDGMAAARRLGGVGLRVVEAFGDPAGVRAWLCAAASEGIW